MFCRLLRESPACADFARLRLRGAAISFSHAGEFTAAFPLRAAIRLSFGNITLQARGVGGVLQCSKESLLQQGQAKLFDTPLGIRLIETWDRHLLAQHANAQTPLLPPAGPAAGRTICHSSDQPQFAGYASQNFAMKYKALTAQTQGALAFSFVGGAGKTVARVSSAII